MTFLLYNLGKVKYSDRLQQKALKLVGIKKKSKKHSSVKKDHVRPNVYCLFLYIFSLFIKDSCDALEIFVTWTDKTINFQI